MEKNQDRHDAEIASGAERLRDVLERVPVSNTPTNFQPVPLNENEAQSSTPTEDSQLDGVAILPNARQTENVVTSTNEVQQIRKKRTCKVIINGISCPHPEICPGKMKRANCFLIIGGDPNKNFKRVIKTQPEGGRTCFICRKKKCPGISMRKLCTEHPQNTK